MIQELIAKLKESESESAAQREVIRELTMQLKESELENATQREVIQELITKLKESEVHGCQTELNRIYIQWFLDLSKKVGWRIRRSRFWPARILRGMFGQ